MLVQLLPTARNNFTKANISARKFIYNRRQQTLATAQTFNVFNRYLFSDSRKLMTLTISSGLTRPSGPEL